MGTQVILAFIVGLVLTLIVMPILIPILHKINFAQTEREEGLASHKVKSGTPTMGGIVFVLVPVLASICIEPMILHDPQMQIILLAFVGYAIIGFIDDFIIVVQKNNNGLPPKIKFLMQSVLAVIFFLMYRRYGGDTILALPIADTQINLGPVLYFILVFIMFTAESNAVNLTDGLDGLCAGTVLIALVPFALFTFNEHREPMLAFELCLMGSLLGYLWFNKHPARIFMGDSGSLALGGLLAAIALVLHKEILLIIIGGVFVMEVLSVVIQVTSYKTRHKRVFKMAPIHHHFEALGMSETKVVLMFYIIGIVLAFIGYMMGVI